MFEILKPEAKPVHLVLGCNCFNSIDIIHGRVNKILDIVDGVYMILKSILQNNFFLTWIEGVIFTKHGEESLRAMELYSVDNWYPPWQLAFVHSPGSKLVGYILPCRSGSVP